MAPSKNSLEVKLQRQITAAIAASADLETALGRILRAAVRLCGAHMGWISLFTGSGQELEIAAALGTKISVVGQRVPLAGSLSGLAITSGHSVRSTDARNDRRIGMRVLGQETGVRGVLIAPLPSRAGILGTLTVANRTARPFTSQAVLTHVATSASIAIQIARLQAQLKGGILSTGEPEPRALLQLSTPSADGDHGAPPSRPTRASGGAAPHLSPREHQIIELLITGKTYREVASALHLSARTVEHYVEHLKHRFHQPRLAVLASYLTAHRLIEPAS